MARQKWFFLLKCKELRCYHCGLLILSKKHLTGDHFPIPRSKGGTETVPSHYWCDQAHGNKSKLTADDLIRLVEAWKAHKRKIPLQVYESIKALKERSS